MADASMGHKARMSFAANGTAIGSYSAAVDFISESLARSLNVVDANGIRGSRSHAVERCADGTYNVGGSISLYLTTGVPALLYDRSMGGTVSGGTYSLAETLTEFDVLVDRVAKRFVYAFCKVSRATWRGAAGGAVTFDVDLVGKTETVSATSFPSITAPVDAPYMFQSGVLTLLASARDMMDFEVSIDNAVEARFTNSQTATDVHPTDRIVTLSCTVPYDSTNADLHPGGVGVDATGSLVFTSGATTHTMTFAMLTIEDVSPKVNSKGEIVLAIRATARMSSTTRELVITVA